MPNGKFLIVILLFVGANVAKDVSDVKGRLLTPDEGCGVSNAKINRIVGGGDAKNGAWPWIALVGRKLAYSEGFYYHFGCAGTLITSKHVLSAAHCFTPVNFFDTVRLGEHDQTTEDDGEHIDIPIDHVDTHANFTTHLSFYTYDIAMIHLPEHISFNDRVRPICVPDDGQTVYLKLNGQNPFVAGWGNLQQGGRASQVLQQLQVPVHSNKDCKEKYQLIYRGHDIQDYRLDDKLIVCAGFMEGGKDSCQGDSGGPLMLPMPESKGHAFYLIGVVSSGLGCALPYAVGMYTNVQWQMDWIREKLY